MMKWTMVLAAVIMAGCVSDNPNRTMNNGTTDAPLDNTAKDSARRAFEQWREALIARNSEQTLTSMSVQLIADWVLTIMRDKNDAQFQQIKGRLDTGNRLELEYWFRRNADIRDDFSGGRAILLPETVIGSRWIVELWNTYFLADADQQRHFAQRMEIAEIYPDINGVTVTVRIDGALKMYGMVSENGTWKLDYLVRNPTRSRN